MSTLAYEAEARDSKNRKQVPESAFEELRSRVLHVCSQHGPTGYAPDVRDPWYYVVDQRYDSKWTVWIELYQAEGVTTAWLEDLRVMLGEFSDASLILVNRDVACAELFDDALVAFGNYAECRTLPDWLAHTRKTLELAATVERIPDVVEGFCLEYRGAPRNTRGRTRVGEESFNEFWTRLFDACKRHGPTGPDRDVEEPWYYVVSDRYEPIQCAMVEVLRPDGLTQAWLSELRGVLAEYNDASFIIGNLESGSAELFPDALVVSSTAYAGCRSVSQWLEHARRAIG